METKKFEQLDSLRFFAVMMVLITHWGCTGSFTLTKLNGGARGVDLFFVISGFLITLGLIRSKFKEQDLGISLYKFYIRRSLRIFPLYYLVIIMLWYFYHTAIADSLLWYVFYAGNFYNIKIQGWGDLGHLWSLAVEEQFYLVWPLIILMIPNRFLAPMICGAVLTSLAAKIIWQIQGQTFWISYMHPLATLDSLAIGALLSYFYHFHQDKLRSALFNPYITAAIFAETFVCLYIQFTPYYIFYNVGVRICFGIFCAWLIGRAVFSLEGIVGYILNLKVLRYIGTISYAIYLFHPFVPDVLSHFFKLPESNNIKCIIYVTCTFTAASVSWYLFESQILKLKKLFE